MSEHVSPQKNFVPHIVMGVIALAIVVAAFFWPTADEPAPSPPTELPQSQPAVDRVTAPAPAEPESQPIAQESEQAPASAPAVIAEPKPEYIEPEPQPLDISDAAVKTALAALSEYESLSRLLVNEQLLQRFVVVINNIAEGEMAPNHPLFVPPAKAFRVYQQAGREWIDAASYKRYTAYVDVLDSMPNNQLMALYRQYKPAIAEIYAEIGDPDTDFDYILEDALNHLLDTPEIRVPVEVYTDSVMYKYRDERLQALTPPQKQLLRTGPDNMRRIKAKLRELKQALQG